MISFSQTQRPMADPNADSKDWLTLADSLELETGVIGI